MTRSESPLDPWIMSTLFWLTAGLYVWGFPLGDAFLYAAVTVVALFGGIPTLVFLLAVLAGALGQAWTHLRSMVR